jgi:hypothetical protein
MVNEALAHRVVTKKLVDNDPPGFGSKLNSAVSSLLSAPPLVIPVSDACDGTITINRLPDMTDGQVFRPEF